jgi:Protein of unknown function (DUF4236)
MGLRYRSSIRLARGLRINLSKSGASLSVGRRGATLNLGPRGARATVGLPGTGISYSEAAPWHRRVASSGSARSGAFGLLVLLLFLGGILIALVF